MLLEDSPLVNLLDNSKSTNEEEMDEVVEILYENHTEYYINNKSSKKRKGQ